MARSTNPDIVTGPAASVPGPAPATGHDLWLARHGETEWARLGRHTGRTDVPLTENGRDQARMLGRRLAGQPFAMVLTSPLSRATETAALAGFGETASVEPDLREWDYGALEGRMTADIRVDYPGWSIWTGPWPGGETIDEVAARADRVIARVRAVDGDVLVFAHGHLLRILAARWLGLPPAAGRFFALGTATLSTLGWERENAVIQTWNEASRQT
jgi:probable phosphoglycerate mutase